MKNLHKRFEGAPWMGSQLKVNIAGCGGVGHGLFLELCAMKCVIKIFDYDKVEEHNCIPQKFSLEQIGLSKVYAAAQNARDFLDYHSFSTQATKWAPCTFLNKTDVLISCVDNMKGRKQLLEIFKKFPEISLFIDARCLAETFHLYSVHRDQIKEYENTLFLDSEASNVNCSYRQTRFGTSLIQGYIAQYVANHARNLMVKERIYSVPFLKSYNGECYEYD